MKLTKPQQVALKRIYQRKYMIETYLTFRRRVFPYYDGGCAMIQINNMVLGIEPDGHVHS